MLTTHHWEGKMQPWEPSSSEALEVLARRRGDEDDYDDETEEESYDEFDDEDEDEEFEEDEELEDEDEEEDLEDDYDDAYDDGDYERPSRPKRGWE